MTQQNLLNMLFITKFNVLCCISLSETLFWTGARGRIPITLSCELIRSSTDMFLRSHYTLQKFSPGGDGGSGRRPLPPDHLTFW